VKPPPGDLPRPAPSFQLNEVNRIRAQTNNATSVLRSWERKLLRSSVLNNIKMWIYLNSLTLKYIYDTVMLWGIRALAVLPHTSSGTGCCARGLSRLAPAAEIEEPIMT
jgi:hypothetical protein